MFVLHLNVLDAIGLGVLVIALVVLGGCIGFDVIRSKLRKRRWK